MKIPLSFVLFFVVALGASAQSLKDHNNSKSYEAVLIRQHFRTSPFRCGVEAGSFSSLIDLKKATDGKDCENAKELFTIDFDKFTLITYQISGDCRVRAEVEVQQMTDEKKYQVLIKEIYGGCRAAGRFQEWIVIDKMPADYKVVFSVRERDEANDSQ